MEEIDFGSIFFVLIIMSLLGYILYSIVKLPYDLIVGYRNFSKGYNSKHNPSQLTGNHPVVISFLNKNSFYKALSPDGKEKFSERLVVFLADKGFVGMSGLVVTDEMRVMISASAIQLTFGLDKYLLLHFHTIKIYSEVFHSKLAGGHLKGGATPNGTIMLSWKDFLHGNAIPNDNLNLGMHEMAHALLLDMLYGAARNLHLESEIGAWEREGEYVMRKLREKIPSVLREYGSANEHEFFAVTVEHFFESPHELKTNLPAIYKQLCILLNQDPQNVHGDFGLTN